MTPNEEAVAAMLADLPPCDRAIVVYPMGTESGAKWYGMSPEQAAIMLYHVADEIVRQRVPMKEPGSKAN